MWDHALGEEENFTAQQNHPSEQEEESSEKKERENTWISKGNEERLEGGAKPHVKKK